MSTYRILFRFRGGLSPSQRMVFAAAGARIERVIVEDLPALDGNTGLVIDAQGVSIDGPRGILGQAGPTILRPSNLGRHSFLPAKGVMSFDIADLAAMESDGTLLDVIAHEMLHVVGVGTIWDRKNRLAGAGGANPRFLGPKAATAYTALLSHGATLAAVPVENMGGGGTRDSHWRERSLSNELMTGYVSPAGVKNPLSAVTIGSLADLGYTVDATAAEAYALPSHLEMLTSGAPVERRHCIGTVPFTAESV